MGKQENEEEREREKKSNNIKNYIIIDQSV